MSRQARVILAYATVKLLDPVSGSTVRSYYKDAVFPDSADPEDVERLVRRGYAEWVENDAPAPVAEPTPDEVDDGLEPQRPGDSASKAAWVDYAVACREDGVSEEDARVAAEAMTKADLITVHG